MGAPGHLKALTSGASDTIGFDKVHKVINHITTDGESKSTGHQNGLWKLLDNEREKNNKMPVFLPSIRFVQYIKL